MFLVHRGKERITFIPSGKIERIRVENNIAYIQIDNVLDSFHDDVNNFHWLLTNGTIGMKNALGEFYGTGNKT